MIGSTGIASEVQKRKWTSLAVHLRSSDLLETLSGVERERGPVLLVNIEPQLWLILRDMLEQGSPHSPTLRVRRDEQHVDLAGILGDEPKGRVTRVDRHPEVSHLREIARHQLLVPVDVLRRQKPVTRLDSRTPNRQQRCQVVVSDASNSNRHGDSLHKTSAA